jgi:hypothetical protein
LRLYNADGTFTPIATHRELGRVVTPAARPPARRGARVRHLRRLRAAHVQDGPRRSQSRRLVHARVVTTGERQYDVGFEDIFFGGDRDYDDNVFRFTGGLAPNRRPAADDQALSVTQGGTLPITLAGRTPAARRRATRSPTGRRGALRGRGRRADLHPAAGLQRHRHVRLHRGRRCGRTRRRLRDGTRDPDRSRIERERERERIGPIDDCAGELTLLNVRRIGRRVLLTGLPERTLARTR